MDTERIAAYLRHEIVEWTKAGGTVIALAKAVGVSGPYISQLRAGQRGVGLGAMQGFADHWGITLAQLEERAAAWAKANPSALPETRIELDDRYPNRARAVKAAELLGVPRAAIDDVLSIKMKSDVDLSPSDWLDEIRSSERRLARGLRVDEGATLLQPGPPAAPFVPATPVKQETRTVRAAPEDPEEQKKWMKKPRKK